MARFFRILDDEIGNAAYQSMGDARGDRRITPRQVTLHFARFTGHGACEIDESVGRACVAIEQHILDVLEQGWFNFLIDTELPGVDDGHVETGLDAVIQEGRMHGLTHRIIATKGERHIAQAATDQRIGQLLLDQARGVKEGARVVIVLGNAGRDRQHIRVEDDVFRWEAHLFGKQTIGARADLELTLAGVGLSALVKRHHHHGRAVAAHQTRLLEEFLLAFLQADGIDDALALQATQARFQHFPLGRIKHHRHATDVRI